MEIQETRCANTSGNESGVTDVDLRGERGHDHKVEPAPQGLFIVTGETRAVRIARLRDLIMGFRAAHAQAVICGVLDAIHDDIHEDALSREMTHFVLNTGELGRAHEITRQLRTVPDLVIIDEIDSAEEAQAVLCAVMAGYVVFVSILAVNQEDGVALWRMLEKELANGLLPTSVRHLTQVV